MRVEEQRDKRNHWMKGTRNKGLAGKIYQRKRGRRTTQDDAHPGKA